MMLFFLARTDQYILAYLTFVAGLDTVKIPRVHDINTSPIQRHLKIYPLTLLGEPRASALANKLTTPKRAAHLALLVYRLFLCDNFNVVAFPSTSGLAQLRHT